MTAREAGELKVGDRVRWTWSLSRPESFAAGAVEEMRPHCVMIRWDDDRAGMRVLGGGYPHICGYRFDGAYDMKHLSREDRG